MVKKTGKLKLILVGMLLILGGIGILVYNFVFSQITWVTGVVPAVGVLMIVLGYMFIRRAFWKPKF